MINFLINHVVLRLLVLAGLPILMICHLFVPLIIAIMENTSYLKELQDLEDIYTPFLDALRDGGTYQWAT